MNTKTRIVLVLTFIGVVLLFSCGTNQTDSLDANAIRTQAVATYASSLTETLVAVPTAFPTLTAVSTSTPAIITPTTALTIAASPTPNPCYKLIWLQDVTVPDGTQMKAGEGFTKTWLVQNTGVCAWHAGFTFSNVGGDPMQGKAISLQAAIPSGAKHEISIQLTVPSGVTGLVQSSWRMADENGTYFGDTLSVNIVVGDVNSPAATATP